MRTFILIFILFDFLHVSAQENVKQFYRMQGEVMDEGDSLRSLQDVSIYNKTQHKQYITGADGKFSLAVNEGDTIKFQKLGYGSKFYYFKSFLHAENYSVQVLMNTDTLHLKTFVVKSLTREKEIQNLFMNSYIRDSLRMINYLKKLYAQQNKSTLNNLVDFGQSPISFIYDSFTKKARNNRKIERAREIIRQNKAKPVKDDYAR